MTSEITEFSFGKGQACPPLKPGVLRLYSMRFCPYAQRTRLVIEHKGIPVETVNINLKRKPKWLFDMNPTGVVPVLQWNDRVLYESGTCNDYLDDVYPEQKLNPTDPYQRARDRQLWESMGKLISSFYEVGPGVQKKDYTALDRMLRAFARYEKELVSRGDGPFFGGKKVCMADFMLWPWFERLQVLNSVVPETTIKDSNFPRLASWIRHMYELPAVKKTMFDKDHHAHFMKSLKIDKNPDYDYGLVSPARL
ncbi:glutathione S-transferase omega-1-like [Mercenaria mercenaria]|uniref:glutathione S-transferase omega-1-like n=1 Tax=Mercenaria mercenaria TaxID=6596 RepID=UPI00234F1CC4|nr:glutathione S-transferase omega-1-like [Mercenaria mercenaria]